ncbi:MAG: ATP-binding protein [Actinomycetota bacterium]
MVADRGVRPRPAATGWRARLGTVRVRTTLLAMLIVAFALVVGAAGLVLSLRRSLTDEIGRTAELRADDVAAALKSGTAVDSVLVAGDDDESFVLVVDPSGAVLAASPNLADPTRVAPVPLGAARRVDDVRVAEHEPGDETSEEEDFMVAARAADTGSGDVLVLAGRSFDIVDEPAGALAGVLVVGVPVLLVVLGASAWVLVGRALAPVEAMRREVEGITSSALDRRVAVPGGTDEVARLASTLNAMLDRLDRGQQRQRLFVSDASHELRSPVAAIRQHAEVAAAHPAATSVGDLASEVVVDAHRLQRLVDDLLLVARADERTLAVEPREVDVDDLALDEARRLRDTTDLRVDTSGVAAGRVKGDRPLLARALRNLGDNAARHARTVVALTVAESAGIVHLAVDDDGPGIPAAERTNVFERFVRLDDARARDTGGTGLGLAIVQEVATAHGGTVAARDSALGGARIELALPAAG